ncbi:MAG: HD-GYP domain-containing protein [Oxalobacteraceae bacterium]|nr:HD-GYP domain-containing protein [Oxalobacteraceae bacterium]
MTATPNTIHIVLEQLCVGLYVHLDIPWLDHGFARNSFKISNEEDLAAIKKLGLKKIRFDPARSDCSPSDLSPQTKPVAAVEITAPTAAEITVMEAKKARVERLNQTRNAVSQCEKQFAKAATTIRSISRNIFSRPQETREEADQLVQQMLDSLLINKDVAIHLMNDKIAGEEMYYHSLNVTVLAMMLAKELGLPAADIRLLGTGCLFHDIGKIEMPSRIVNKTEALTSAERNLMQQHCQYGDAIAQKLGLPGKAIEIIRKHHEYADGSGYPMHLKAEQIPFLVSIVTIVNTYDNHCNHPNPLDSLSPYEALSIMFTQQRKLFAPDPLNVFIRCMGVYPPGTIVRLSDGTLGMVISVNSGMPLRPSILIYDSSIPKSEAIILDLISEPELNIGASLKPRQLEPEVYDYLSPRKRMSYFMETHKTPARAR